MLITTEISSEKNKGTNHIWNIMLKHQNILPTRTIFFILSTGKFENVHS